MSEYNSLSKLYLFSAILVIWSSFWVFHIKKKPQPIYHIHSNIFGVANTKCFSEKCKAVSLWRMFWFYLMMFSCLFTVLHHKLCNGVLLLLNHISEFQSGSSCLQLCHLSAYCIIESPYCLLQLHHITLHGFSLHQFMWQGTKTQRQEALDNKLNIWSIVLLIDLPMKRKPLRNSVTWDLFNARLSDKREYKAN